MKENSRSNPRFCPVCNHPQRAEIENVVLSMSASNPSLTLDAIADAFDITSSDLRVHTLMHTPLALDFSAEAEETLVANFKSRVNPNPNSNSTATTPLPNQTTIPQSGLPNANSVTNTTNVPLVGATQSSATKQRERMTDKVNFRESDMLLAAANEYLTTMTTLGRRIKRFASDNQDGSDQRLTAFCNTAIVNLYIGCGSELRNSIKGINEMNTSVNGSHDPGAEGLVALANAITGVKNDDDSETGATKGAQFLDHEFDDLNANDPDSNYKSDNDDD